MEKQLTKKQREQARNEVNVYIACADDIENFRELSNEEVIEYCEEHGEVLTLAEFQANINSDMLGLENSFIRII